MEALNKSIGLRVVGHHIRGRDPEKAVEFGPQMAGELRAMVEGNVIGHSEAGYPVMDEGSCTGLGGRVRQWYGFRPLGKAINNCKEDFMSSDSSRGPTKSMWRLPNLRSGCGHSVKNAWT